MSGYAIFTLLSSIACVWAAAVVYHGNPKAALNRVFTAASGAAAYMLFYFFMCLQAESPAVASLWIKIGSGWYFVIPLMMHFVLVFTEKKRLLGRWFARPLLYAPAVLFCIVNLATDYFIGEPQRYAFGGFTPYRPRENPGWLWYAMAGWVILLAVLGIVLCIHHHLRQRDRGKKKRTGIVLVSLLVPFFITVFEELLVLIGVNLDIQPVDVVSIVWLTGWIGFAVWRYDLFKVDPVTAAENVMATIPDSLFIIDRAGVLASVNRVLAGWLGVGEDSLRGRPVRTLLADGPEGDAVCAELLAGKRLENAEIRLRRPDGKDIPVLLSASAIEKRGRTIGHVCIGKDITERKHAEQMLLDLNDRLCRSNRELEDFAASASHDLQAPLRKIMLAVERLSAPPAAPADPAGDVPTRIGDAVRRMQRLIADLLAYAQITGDSGRRAAVDLNRVLREVITDLEANIEKAGAVIDCGALPVVTADDTRMRQLFQNLVGNAVKFHRPGVPPRIAVYATNGALPGYVSVAVKDEGVGIDPRHHERIFGAFQRLHGADEFEGSGIGLAVCKKIVEAGGGSIRVESRPGEGSVFTVILPAA